MTAHEDLHRVEIEKSSSHRAFGWVFVIVFTLIGVWPIFFGGQARGWALITAAGIGVVTILAPVLLALPSRLWQRFGTLLHHIVSPLVLVFMFYIVVTPMAVLMRRFSKTFKHWRPSGEGDSYWITREPPGPKPDSMHHQF